MAMRYGYFDSEIVGYDSEGMPILDRAETSELLCLIFAMLLTNGVLAKPSDCFQVIEDEGMYLKIKAGFGLIKGHFAYDNEESIILISDAPKDYKRIDIVVLRLNKLERICEIVVKEGVPATNPVAPELLQPISGDYYELCLAEIAINANQTVITQSNITDTRADSSKCGFITQFIDSIDTSVFFAQLNSFYEEFVSKSDESYEKFLVWAEEKKAEIIAWQEAEENAFDTLLKNAETEFLDWYTGNTENWETDFNTWFENLKEQLTDNVATHLQDQIGNLNLLNTTDKTSLVDAVNSITNDISKVDNILKEITEEEIDDIIQGTYEEIE